MMFLRIVTILVLYASGEASENSSSIDEHPSWSWIPKDICGTEVGRPKIIGGADARPGQFPWFARLGEFVKERGKLHVQFLCGGALITKFYVLSAAHCGTYYDIVRLGQYTEHSENCENWKCGPPAQDISIDSYFINEYYDKATEHNDIMMILLKTPAEFNEFIIPLCLPRGELLTRNFEGEYFRLAGWGVTDTRKGNFSKTLLFVDLPMVNDDICMNRFREPVLESQYCFGIGGGKAACFGDSGGPITRAAEIDGREQTFIFGIASFGLVICGSGPGVYTKVISFMPWILDHITKH